MNKKIAFIGSGQFGTALAYAYSQISKECYLWTRDQDVEQEINHYHTNNKYLQDIELPKNIKATNNIQKLIQNAEIIFWCIPTQSTIDVLKNFKPYLQPSHYIIVTSKGMECESHKLIIDIFLDALGAHFKNSIFYYSGPSFSKELILKKPTAVTLSSSNIEKINYLQDKLQLKYLRLYGNRDIVGIQILAAVKNIIAIIVGCIDEMNLGNNARATLMTRAISEMSKLCYVLGGKQTSLIGLAGLGDIILTCTGDLSRNRQFGKYLAQGLPIETILEKVQFTVEGYYTTKVVYHIIQEKKIDLIIFSLVYKVLYENLALKEAITVLLDRPSKFEDQDLEVQTLDEYHLPWKNEFLKNLDTYVELGIPREQGKQLLEEFLEKSIEIGSTQIEKIFESSEALYELGTYTKPKKEIRNFMIKFITPFFKFFKLNGSQYFDLVLNLIQKNVPVVFVSNHLSHFDTLAIFILLYHSGANGKKLAENLVFIAGRPIFESSFTRLALYMIHSLMVCSKKDLTENVNLAETMTKINIMSFKKSTTLQKEGKIIVVYPEGTRSRDGHLKPFIDTVYHYINNKVVVPISLIGTDKILPTDSFMMHPAVGEVNIGQPVYMQTSNSTQITQLLNPDIPVIIPPESVNKKIYLMDQLAIMVSQKIKNTKQGVYKSLYKDNVSSKHQTLIQKVKNPQEVIIIIGHSQYSTAIATILSNHDVEIIIFLLEESQANDYNAKRVDSIHFPLIKLPPNITFSSNIDDIKKATFIIQGVVVWDLDSYYNQISHVINQLTCPIVNIIKGFVSSKELLILKTLEKKYQIDTSRLAMITGLNFPDEIVYRKLVGFKYYGYTNKYFKQLKKMLITSYSHLELPKYYHQIDRIQFLTSLYNIYAIGIGLLDSYYKDELGGANDASLFYISTWMFQEMNKIIHYFQQEKIEDSNSITEFMLICFSRRSSNYKYGFNFLKKPRIKIQPSGVYALQKLIRTFDAKASNYPILNSINNVIHHNQSMENETQNLLFTLKKNKPYVSI